MILCQYFSFICSRRKLSDRFHSRNDRSQTSVTNSVFFFIYLNCWCAQLINQKDSSIMPYVSNQCAAQSLGPANELFGALVQTILSVQCAISPPELWPKDFGPSAMQNGETSISIQLNHIKRHISKWMAVHCFVFLLRSAFVFIELTISVE